VIDDFEDEAYLNTLNPAYENQGDLFVGKKAQDFEPDELSTCKNKCNNHGICYEEECYCELGNLKFLISLFARFYR
jgi:hypothetical protein